MDQISLPTQREKGQDASVYKNKTLYYNWAGKKQKQKKTKRKHNYFTSTNVFDIYTF